MEDLIIIKENGEIQVRTMFGTLKTLFNVIKDTKAIDYRVFNTINTFSGTYTTGVVVLTAKNKFVIVKDIYDPKLLQFPELPSASNLFILCFIYFLYSNKLFKGSNELDSWCIISTDKKCFILASKGPDIYQLTFGGSPQILVCLLFYPLKKRI
jgi:hypothetical protein